MRPDEKVSKPFHLAATLSRSKAMLVLVCSLGAVSLAVAQDTVPSGVGPDKSNSKQLMDKLVKERSSGSVSVLKMADWIKQSVQLVTLTQGLNDVVRSPLLEAVTAHPSWESADMGVEYAQASADESRSALLPQISGGMDYGTRANGANPISRLPASSYTSTSAQLAAKQLLFDGDSKFNSWKSAQKKVEAQTARSYIQRSELMLSVLEAAMNRQRFEIQRLWVNSIEEQRKDTARKISRRFEMGSGTIYDIARSDIKINDSRLNLQQIGIQLSNANTVLQEFNLPEDLALPTVSEQIAFSNELLDQLLSEHPLMMEAQASIMSSELDVAAAKASQMPVIQLELSRTDRSFETTSGKSADYSTLVTLTHNFYSGGSTTARMSQAVARLGQARSDLESKKKGLRTAFLRSVSEANNSHASLGLRKVGVEASAASFAATVKLFEVSRGSLQDLQRAEDELYVNVKQLIDNWFDASIAYYRYLHVTNTLTTHLLKPQNSFVDSLKPVL